jgi:hypothetical protein
MASRPAANIRASPRQRYRLARGPSLIEFRWRNGRKVLAIPKRTPKRRS